MKTSLLLSLLVIAGMNLFLPGEVFFFIMIVLTVLISLNDKAAIYNSSFLVILPFLLVVCIGVIRGLDNINRDFYRDSFIFSKNIVYFLGGVALSKHLKDFGTFFRYFLIIAFVSALIHIGTFIGHIQSISSLESIRHYAGFGNEVEGIVLSLVLSRIFNKNFRKLIKDFRVNSKIMVIVIAISFLLYFSRTLIVLVIILPLFLSETINIRQIFSRKNAKIFKVSIAVFCLFYLLSFIASLQSANSPLLKLVDKFERIPDEIGWNAQKNTNATKEDIRNNWRGYEAYQGLLKFNQGNTLQKCFGYGFGETVDLGLTMKLAGNDFDRVPILHNEYVGLLVKSGIIGLVLYLFFLYKIGWSKIKYYKDDHPKLYYSYQMLSALSLISLLNTYIGFGLLDPASATIPILFGFFWGNIQRQQHTLEPI